MRTAMRSGSSQFVTNDVKIHAHHTAIRSSAICTAPTASRRASSVCESCVTANTNTRSKNSLDDRDPAAVVTAAGSQQSGLRYGGLHGIAPERCASDDLPLVVEKNIAKSVRV